MTHPGSKSSKIALQNETVGVIEEQLPDDKQGVCHTVALPFTLKKNLKAKKELWKFKYFTMPNYIIFQNIL